MIARLVMVAWLVLLVALVAHWWQARDGRVRTSVGLRAGGGRNEVGSPAGKSASPVVDTAVTSAVLVSTPTCRTCPGVRDALSTVSEGVEGFTFEEVDASTRLDFVRTHGVRRAPTVLFRDADGAEVARAAGPVSLSDVAAMVGWTAMATPA